MFIVIAVLAFTARLAAADDDGTTAADTSVSGDLAEAASFDPTWDDAGTAEQREVALRRDSSRIGRVDLSVTWRRTRTAHDAPDVPSGNAIAVSGSDLPAVIRTEWWILATWRL